MEDNHGIIAAAEARGYIAVFPNGLPRASCTALPCLDNNWAEPDNVFFIAELIDRQKATGLVARRPHPSGRLLRRRLADLRHRRHPGLPACDQLGRDGRRRVRPLPRRPPRRRLRRDPAPGGHAGQRAARPGRPRRPGCPPPAASTRPAASPTSRSAPRSTTGGWSPAPRPRRRSRSTCGPRPAGAGRPRGASLQPAAARPSSRCSTPACEHAWPDWNVMAVATELFERE